MAKQASIRQKRVFQLASQGMPVKQAMLKSGYSKATQVDRVTKSKSWQKLLGKISDEKLIRRLNQGLDALDEKGKPDHNTRFRFLHETLDLKGRLNHEPTQFSETTINLFTIEQRKEIARRIISDSGTLSRGFDIIPDSDKSEILAKLAPRNSSEGIT